MAVVEGIIIGVNNHLPAIRAGLKRELPFLEREGLYLDIKEEWRGDMVFLDCDFKRGGQVPTPVDEAEVLLRQCVANALSEVIVSHFEGSLVREIIQEHYSYFKAPEQKKIMELTHLGLNGSTKKGTEGYIYNIHRKARILYKLLDYLGSNNKIILDGFIRFRLKEYLAELREVVDRAVDDMMLEKEYREFIHLLRYFVEVQEPKRLEIHVIMAEGNKYHLMDGEGETISDDELEDMLLDLSQGEVSSEDLLISALISLAPARLHLHLGTAFPNREVVETIKKVFAGRISICFGCDLCKKPDTDEGKYGKPR